MDPNKPVKVHYEYHEPPLSLNAWTQTKFEDFPVLPPRKEPGKSKLLLRKRIGDLQEIVNAKNKVLEELKNNRTQIVSPEEADPNRTAVSSSEKKHEGLTYRIVNQSELNNETHIEIEFSDDMKPDSSTPEVYASTSQTPEIEPGIREGDMYSFGPNKTQITMADFEKISWSSASAATRKLLTLVFDRVTLATHSMTGKASPAFYYKDKPIKESLDPNVIEDIVFIVSNKCGVSKKEVRSAITTKCADENKMLKLKQLKRLGPTDPRRSALSEMNQKRI